MQDKDQHAGLNPTDAQSNKAAEAFKAGQSYSADSGLASRDEGSQKDQAPTERGRTDKPGAAGDESLEEKRNMEGSGAASEEDISTGPEDPAGNL